MGSTIKSVKLECKAMLKEKDAVIKSLRVHNRVLMETSIIVTDDVMKADNIAARRLAGSEKDIELTFCHGVTPSGTPITSRFKLSDILKSQKSAFPDNM